MALTLPSMPSVRASFLERIKGLCFHGSYPHLCGGTGSLRVSYPFTRPLILIFVKAYCCSNYEHGHYWYAMLINVPPACRILLLISPLFSLKLGCHSWTLLNNVKWAKVGSVNSTQDSPNWTVKGGWQLHSLLNIARSFKSFFALREKTRVYCQTDKLI